MVHPKPGNRVALRQQTPRTNSSPNRVEGHEDRIADTGESDYRASGDTEIYLSSSHVAWRSVKQWAKAQVGRS
jgi:hypothetical protein